MAKPPPKAISSVRRLVRSAIYSQRCRQECFITQLPRGLAVAALPPQGLAVQIPKPPNLFAGSRHDVSGVPTSDICSATNAVRCYIALLFNHLVGAGEQRLRHGEAQRLRGLEIDHQLELGRRLRR
jgi:hypothetical protein